MRLKSLYLITPILATNRTRIIIGLISLIIVDILQLIVPRIIKRAVDDLTLYSDMAPDLWRHATAIIAYRIANKSTVSYYGITITVVHATAVTTWGYNII